MAKAAADINWKYPGDAIPAFITIAIMPFTYSIAYGLIGGIMSYILINTIVWLIQIASKGKIVPANKEFKDPWTYKIPGGFLPPWIQRAAKGQKDFWREHPEHIGEDVEDRVSHSSTSTPGGLEKVAIEQPKSHEGEKAA
jgi:AGZA family xanthine/uracil permease-like MFS transporter